MRNNVIKEPVREIALKSIQAFGRYQGQTHSTLRDI